MIFAMSSHIEQIIKGIKTQTRRASNRYQVGKLYSIQPGRTEKGVSEGKILIIDKLTEIWPLTIKPDDAKAEGGYTSKEFEELYDEMYPKWSHRTVYIFHFVPKDMKH